jgi:CRISPR/Cas system-associated protein Csm6
MTDNPKQTYEELLQITTETDQTAQEMHDKVLRLGLESGDPLLLDFIKAAIMSSQYAYMATKIIRDHLLENCRLSAESIPPKGMSYSDKLYVAFMETFTSGIVKNYAAIFKMIPTIIRTSQLCRGATKPEEMFEGLADLVADIISKQSPPES